MIQEMNREAVQQISDEVGKALVVLEQQLGVTITSKGGTYDTLGGTYVMKLEVKLAGEAGEQAALANFERGLRLLGTSVVKPEHYGMAFRAGKGMDGMYTLVGVNVDAWKYPFLGRRSDGKTFKFSQAMIEHTIRVNENMEASA